MRSRRLSLPIQARGVAWPGPYDPLPAILLSAALLGCDDPAGPADTPEPGTGPAVGLELVVEGLTSPVDFQAPPGDARSFIVEQPGRVRILEDDALDTAPFLDITDRVGSGGERGLLGLAFGPDFSASGVFYVHYTDVAGRTVLSRFRTGADPDAADPGSEEVLLRISQPFSNHNGGQLSFGPDGHLYLGLGDGGSANDPLGSGQDTGTLLGTILRLSVTGSGGYGIPPGNPFIGDPNGRDEIWAYGLRNPWKFSWDSGFIFIGDVGQNRWEEINTAPSTAPGRNFGWNILEGDSCVASGCSVGATTLPTLAYDHGDGCSVTGGYVYRGSAVPALQGYYLYGDYCGGWVRAFRLVGRDVEDDIALPLPTVPNLTSFGRDGRGELYVLSQNGSILRFVTPSG